MKKSKIFSICTIVLAALGICLYLFLDAIKGGGVSYNGLEVMFGKKESTILGDITIFKFSFLLFLGFIFAIAGLVITILPMAGVKSKLFPIIALCCFVVAALFAFLTKNVCVLGNGDMGAGKGADLGVGAIIAGILYLLSGCASALPIVIKD